MMTYLVPGSEPFLMPGGRTGCILLHGFTAMPEETRSLGEFLSLQGHTVMGLRLSGHATAPEDLKRTHWEDWIRDVEDGLALLKTGTDRIFLIGQSMGGMISLISAALFPVSGVVSISTPAVETRPASAFSFTLQSLLKPTIYKKAYDPSAPLGNRREPHYPAYPYFPTRILYELFQLRYQLSQALPEVRVPALILQSRNDEGIPADSADYIFNKISTSTKSIFWMEKAGHSILMSDDRQVAFDAIQAFIAEIVNG